MTRIRAFSSEVDTGSHEENAKKQGSRAFLRFNETQKCSSRASLIGAAFVLSLASGVALAAGDNPPSTVNIGPLVNGVLDLLAPILSVAAVWLAKRLADWLKLKQDSEVRAYLNDMAPRAVAYGIERARQIGGSAEVDIKSAAVAQAADYLVQHAPEALKRFGLTGDALVRFAAAHYAAAPSPAA